MDILNSTYYNYKQVGKIHKDNIEIFIRQDVTSSILKKAKSFIYPKTFGLLLGSKIKKENQFIIHIDDIVPLGRIKPEKDPKVLSGKRWEAIETKIYMLYPNKDIVGWYGVRTGWGAMLTGQDQRIHQEFFTKSWQVLYLLDDTSDSHSFFYWSGEKLKLSSGYYEYWDKNALSKKFGVMKNKRLVIAGPSIILAGIFVILLYQQYGQYFFTAKDDKSTIGYMDRPHVDNNSRNTPHEMDQGIKEKSSQDKLNQELKEYGVKIAQLERKLGEKEQEIEILEQKIPPTESSHQPDETDLGEGIIYIVQRGDNLYKISQRFYGTDKYGAALAKVNRIKNQKSLMIGSYILIPPIEEIENIK